MVRIGPNPSDEALARPHTRALDLSAAAAFARSLPSEG
jgi:hypothetical protein